MGEFIKSRVLIIKNLINEFGCGGVRILLYWKRYSNGYSSSITKRIYLKTVARTIYFRPYSTDILLLINLFCRTMNEEEREYKIDLHILGETSQNIVDAGANIGLFTVLYKKIFPDATFICIEPDKNNFELLRLNVQDLSNVILLRGGVWEKDSFLKIIDRGTGEWGFAVEECSEDESICEGYSVESVMKKAKFNRIDIFKMDIEGAEDDIFSADYQNWITKVDCFIIEPHDRIKPGVEKKIMEIMSNYRYQYTKNCENMVFFKEKLRDDFKKI